MNVYLYPSNTETELKNAYIGEYKWYEYSYDFRNKTTTQVTNDGWFTYRDVRSRSVDSNWIHVVWYPWCMWKLIDNSKFTNATKVTISGYINIQTYALHLWFVNSSDVNTGSILYGDSRQSFWNTSIYWNLITQANESLPYWWYEFKVVYDFVNKTATGSITWHSDITWALSDNDIANFKANTNMIYTWFYNNTNSNTASYVRDISLKIEY